MKLSYKIQMFLAILLILGGNVMSDAWGSWIYRSIAWVACGLLFVLNPVLPDNMEPTEQVVRWTRIGGVVIILIGLVSRVTYL